MADFNLGGLLGGGGGLYDDLLTPQQQSQLSSRGLLAMAGAFADAGMPSRLPIPLGAAIGKAAAAMGTGRDQAALQVLQAQKMSQEVQSMKMQAGLQQQMLDDMRKLPLDQLLKLIHPGGVPTPAGVLQSEPLKATPGAPGYGRLTPPGPAAAGGQYAPPAGLLQGGLDSDPSSGNTGVMLPPAPPGYDADLAGPPAAAPAAAAMKASSLDTVLPRGGGPGGLLTPASYNGAAAPGGGNAWLNANAPFPTLQRPGGAPIQWANAPPSGVPFGQDPRDSLPGGGAGTPPFGGPGQGGEIPGAGGDEVGSGGGAPSDPRGLIPYIRERAIANGIDPDVAVKVAQSEGLGPFKSSVIQRNGQREPSYGALQLYTGGGMGNDFQRDTGLDPSDPKNERATIDYALSKAPSTGWTPWHGAAGAGIGPRTGLPGGPDYVVPSGRGVPANMLRQVADNGFSGGGAAPGASGGAPATAAAGGDGQGMNTLLLELAKRNAMAEILKLGNPYSSMLSVLQGSPEYKGQIAGAEAKAQQPYIQGNQANQSYLNILQDMAKDNMTVDASGKVVLLPEAQRIRTMNAEQQAEAKSKWETPVEQPVYSPDGTTKIEKMSPFEFRRREADKARRAALGDTMPRPGDLAATPYYRPGQAEQETQAAQANQQMAKDPILVSDGKGGVVEKQVTVAQAAAIARGEPVPALGVKGMLPPGQADQETTAGTVVNKPFYPPGYEKATEVMLTQRRPKAEAAVQSLNFNETAQRLLDAGVITGWGAQLRLDVAKAKALFGWSNDKIANTEAFLSTQARQVAASLASGAFGSGSSITDNDRAYAAKMAGGDSNLDEASLRFLLRQNNTAARWEIDKYNADVKRHDPKGQLPILRVDEGPKAEAKPSGNQPTPLGGSQLNGKPYIKWSDGQWRPEGELPGQENR